MNSHHFPQLAAMQARSEAFEALLDVQPQSRPCALHPTLEERLNREASFEAASPVYTCPGCSADKLAARRAARIERSGIPADVRHATLENFLTTRPAVKASAGYKSPEMFLAAAREFARGGCRNVAFCGTPGIGKGHLAAALCVLALDAGKTVAWKECARLFSEYHRAYKDGSTEDVTERYAAVQLLVLDELCLRDLPADGEEILFSVFDLRHKGGRPSILLGNKPAEATRLWLGSRISDRLRSGGFRFCYGEWDSLRGQSGDGSEF